MLPKPIKKFIEVFSALPSIGPRQAHRLAFYIHSLGKNKIKEIAEAVADLSNVNVCEQCFFTHGAAPNFQDKNSVSIGNKKNNLCQICANPDRDTGVIAIIEKETDLISIEKTKKFNGRYLILGNLSKDGFLTGEQKRRLNTLKEIATPKKIKEVIIAFSPTTYGDINADIIAQELAGAAARITRLGRGIPTGGEIEFADEETLGGALAHRS